ncbi:MAG TPA: 50S ribosomal protein L35 [Candidatus Paceibacterota bacterium]
MKTNKSFSKRLKVTRKGKIVARKPGQNHFNAKESRRTQMKGRRSQQIDATIMTAKVLQRYIGTPGK